MITSADNPTVKKVRALFKKGSDSLEGIFITEGRKLVGDILRERPELVLEIIYSDSFASKQQDFIRNIPQPVIQKTLDTGLYSRISPLKNPEGILCLCRIPECLDDEAGGNNAVLLFDIQLPENMGTILRSSEIFGFNTVYYTQSCADPYSYKTMRASQAAPVYLVTRRIRSEQAIDLVHSMKNSGYTVISADINGDEELLYGGRLDACSKKLIIVGNEGNGLPKELILASDAVVRIRQTGRIESLNVSCAASILMHHFSV